MSHLNERKEKRCLNCGSWIHGRYCHVCGQENIEPKESVGHLVGHFFKDITHFDGKFFSTIKYLVVRPGFLSGEYMAGRRAAYVNPVRLYVFTSAFFFLLFFAFFEPRNMEGIVHYDLLGITKEEALSMDSASFARASRKVNLERNKVDSPMTRAAFMELFDKELHSKGINIGDGKFKNRAEYDSLLKAGVIHHGFIVRKLVHQVLALNEKYQYNIQEIINAVFNKFLHSLAQILFISLPLFALLLKMLYARRKKYYYTDHAVFSLHYYVFVFFAMLGIFTVMKLNDLWEAGVFTWLYGILTLWMVYYLLSAMKRFYQQGWGKTIAKFLILLVAQTILINLLFATSLFFSFLTI